MKGKEPNKDWNIMRDNSAGADDHATPSACLDTDLYRDDLRELSLSKAQEDELLQTLWNIMSIFVDIGWGADTVQIVLPELFADVAQNSAKLPESEDHLECNGTEREEAGEDHD